jgi:phage-related protein
MICPKSWGSAEARITKALDNTTSTTNATAESFAKWGLSVSQWDAASAEGKIGMLATAYTNAGANANDFLDDVLGPRGAQLAPMLAQWATDAQAAAAVKFSGVDPAQMQQGAIAMAALELQFKQMEITVASELVPTIKGMSTDFEDLAAHGNVVVPILVAIGAAATAFGVATLATKAYEAANALLAPGILAYRTAVEGEIPIQEAFNAVMAANPIALVIIGVAALAVGAYELIEHWRTVSATFESIWSSLRGDLSTFVSYWETQWDLVSFAAQNIWTGLTSFMSAQWALMKTDATAIWTDIETFFSTTWTGISIGATTAWNDIKSFFEGIWNDISSFVSTTVGGIESDLEYAWNEIGSGMTAAWNELETIVNDAWTAIANIVNNAIKQIMGWISNFISDIQSAISWAEKLLGMGGGGGSNAASSPMINVGTHAEGGIATSATAGIFGEAGPEALIPLDSPQGQGLLGGAYFGGNSGGGGNQTVINIQCSGNITQSEESLAQIIMQKIMERVNLLGGNLDATWATGR